MASDATTSAQIRDETVTEDDLASSTMPIYKTYPNLDCTRLDFDVRSFPGRRAILLQARRLFRTPDCTGDPLDASIDEYCAAEWLYKPGQYSAKCTGPDTPVYYTTGQARILYVPEAWEERAERDAPTP